MSELQVSDFYLLNLVVTVGMFVVLIFRAWLEQRHYRTLEREMEWRKNYDLVARILRAEKDLFKGVQGGEELYNILTQMFKIEEKQ